MNKNRKRVTGRVIATACTGLMLMQGVVTPTVMAAELPGSAIEANAYGESSTFTLDSTVKKIKLYETVHLQATLNSKNVEDRYLKWECDNANVANVSNGYITGMNTGRANITVTYLPTGETAHCQLTVGTIPGEDGNEFKLDSSEKKIKLYETIQLKALAGEDVIQDRDLKWESSNKDVANVNNGYVTGMNNGKTTITVTYVPTGLTATCELTVGTIPGENGAEFKIDSSTKAIRLWETVQLKAMAGDDVMADKDIKWESSNPSVATVNNGYVSGISVGTTTIKATYLPTGLVATCEVAVSKDGSVTPDPTPGPGPEEPDPVVNEGELTVSQKVVTLEEGKTTKVVATVGGKAVDTKDLKFVSDKTDVAIVRNDGTILGRKAGKAKVTVTYVPTGKTAEVMVAVEAKETAPEVLEGELVLDQKVVSIEAGKTTKVTATINGKEVPRTDLKWTADKSDIAVVRNDGVILGVKEGKAKVTVTYVPTGKTAEVMVAVTAQKEVLAGEISLDKSYVELQPKDVTKVTATINGKAIPSADYKWTTSDSNVATVKGGGILAVAPGKATITVTYVPTGKTASVEVVVKEAQAQSVDFALDGNVKTVKVGKTNRILAKVDGKSAKLEDLAFTVDKPEVATVNNMGVITGVAAGKAVVTVTYKQTGQTAVCQIAVEKDQEAVVTGITFDSKIKSVDVGKTTRVLVKVNGQNAKLDELAFSVDQEQYATVNKMGVITGVKKGRCVVTVTYLPTGETAKLPVSVH